MWKNNKLDVIIAPGFATKALKNGLSKTLSLAACYAFIWNLLQMTCGNIPITTVR